MFAAGFRSEKGLSLFLFSLKMSLALVANGRLSPGEGWLLSVHMVDTCQA